MTFSTRFRRSMMAGGLALLVGTSISLHAHAAGFITDDSADKAANLPDVVEMIHAGQYDKAIPKLQAMLKKTPENADILNYLAYSQRKSGKLEDAEANYNKALKINPDHLGALEYQGELYIQTNRREMAEQNLAKLGKLCGMDCEQYEDLAKALGK
jgi:predicted Zn-dependent protease